MRARVKGLEPLAADAHREVGGGGRGPTARRDAVNTLRAEEDGRWLSVTLTVTLSLAPIPSPDLGVEEEVEEGAVVDAARAHVLHRHVVVRVLRAPGGKLGVRVGAGVRAGARVRVRVRVRFRCG